MTDTGSAGTALVTGASSGIGRELADVIAADGYDVVVTARREQRLREVADRVEREHGVDATVVAQDLAAAGGARALYDAVAAAGIEAVDVLANNAGVPVYGDFTETDWADERRMLRLNVEAATELAKLYAPEMVGRAGSNSGGGGGPDPAILNTASLASLFPIPGKAVYAGSKAYLLSFSRALAHELEDDGVTVTAVCPGAVETEYATRGDVEESETMSGITSDPRSVAEAAWAGVRDGDRIVFPSAFASYGGQAVRVLPRKAVTKLGERTVEDGASWL
ncbi:SDR family NAD(P)-dependent oxidoreductase [Halobacterium rubrum]|uniref:SDR family NAD(P)-dependent oxidoreductase n=1 Tax=Halobacterium TaxID=2239 RepID=UPI001F3A184D|nr:SDR family NAD(P)-dependent oxidoreductase [Halobacterium rubrum]MDH5018701.1 SDR family NAD(P)-dependent oxidoreductase [Halobacterium rubrum]